MEGSSLLVTIVIFGVLMFGAVIFFALWAEEKSRNFHIKRLLEKELDNNEYLRDLLVEAYGYTTGSDTLLPEKIKAAIKGLPNPNPNPEAGS